MSTERLFGFEICRSTDLRAIGNALWAIQQEQLALVRRLVNFESNIMVTQAQQAQSLLDLGTQLTKAKGEIVAKVQTLEDAINAGGVTSPEVDAAMAALKGDVQDLDDLNPDVVVPPPAPAPAPIPVAGSGGTSVPAPTFPPAIPPTTTV